MSRRSVVEDGKTDEGVSYCVSGNNLFIKEVDDSGQVSYVTATKG